MTTFVFRLNAPRPTFALDMSEKEREIMTRHAEHWRPFVESGQMVIFGPVLEASGSWGLGVVEADDEETLRAFAAQDPVVTTGTGTFEVGKMLAGYVRPRSSPPAPQTTQPAEDPGYLIETGQALGEDGSVVPIIGGLPAAEGSAWDIGAPLADRGAGLAEHQGSPPDQGHVK